MKKILIDGRFIGVGDSMTRYTLEILNGVLKLDKENDYTLLIRPQGKKELARYPEIEHASNLRLEVLDIPHYSLAEQSALLKYLSKEKFDLVHFIQFNHPLRYKKPYVVSIHDLTMYGHLHREKNPIKRLAFKAVMNSAVYDSTKIITISNTTKDDILDNFKVKPEKIEVTYLAVDPKFNVQARDQKSDINKFKEKYKIQKNYFLYTGMWKKHKNILRMLKAFGKYVNDEFLISNDKENSRFHVPNIQLVLVGKIDKEEPEVTDEINRINSSLAVILGDRSESKDLSLKPIITTGFIDERELPIAYAGALAYIIPSLSEGFGLPPLEAMACGTPVISSKESCMPEILGNAAYYFDAYNIDDMADAMGKVVTSEDLRKELIEKGLKQAEKYSWEATAKKTLEVYHEALKV